MRAQRIVFALLCLVAVDRLAAQVPPAPAPAAKALPASGSPRVVGWTGLVFDIKKGRVRIAEVQKNSPAARAGLREKQFIVSIGGRAVTGELDAYTALFGYTGTPVEIVVDRDGVQRTVTVVRDAWRPQDE